MTRKLQIGVFGAEKEADVVIPTGLERGSGREFVLALKEIVMNSERS